MNATKELEQWWRWVDGEAPSTLTSQTKARDVLPDVAEQALRESALMIVDRHGNHAYAPLPGIKPIGWALENHFDAFKPLSLSLCEALEKMRERVPEERHAARVYGQVYGTGLGQHMYIDPASLMPTTCESMGRPHLSATAGPVGQRYCVRCMRHF